MGNRIKVMVALSPYVVALCWATFFLYWLLNWSRVKRTVERQSWSSRLMVVLPVAFGFRLMFSPDQPRVLPNNTGVALLVMSIAIVGLAITIWARFTLGCNWSAAVTFKEGHEFIQHGPYGFVRHPIYTGFLMMMLAAGMTFGSLRALVGVGLGVLGFWYKLRQ